MFLPEISLVIYFKNRIDHLRAYFESLLNQKEIDYEIIVIDYCSNDGSLAYVKSLVKDNENVRMFKVLGDLGFNLSKARNIGCRRAVSKLCMTVDADIHFLSKTSLRTLVDLYNQFNEFICKFHNIINAYKINHLDRGVVCYCGGGNMIFHKSLYKRAGGFPNWIKNHGFEDYIFRLRAEYAGGKILKFPGQRTYNLVETYGPVERDFNTREVIDHNREGYIPCESVWEDPKQNTKNVFSSILKTDINKLYTPDKEKLPAHARVV